MSGRIRLGDLLVRAGVLSTAQLGAALAEQKKWGGRLGKILIDMHFVSESILVRALSKQLGIGVANFKNAFIPPWLRKSLDAEWLRAGGICPFRVDEEQKVMWIAMVDPTNLELVDEVRFRTGYRVEPALAGEAEVHRAIDRLFLQTGTGELELHYAPPPADPGEQELTPSSTKDIEGISQAEAELREHQIQHERALRVMVDLLIEKGVFTREEYLALLTQY